MTSPVAGGRSPHMVLSSVVFPDPLPPMIAISCPRSTISVTSRRVTTPGRACWLTARSSIAARTFSIVPDHDRYCALSSQAAGVSFQVRSCAHASLRDMTVFALLAGIAIGVVIAYLLMRGKAGAAGERARAAQDKDALLEKTMQSQAALVEGRLGDRLDIGQLAGPIRDTLTAVGQH